MATAPDSELTQNETQNNLITDLEQQAQDFRDINDHLSVYQAEKTIKEIKSQQHWTKPYVEAGTKAVVATTSGINGIRTLTNGGNSGIEIAMGVCDIVGGVLQAVPGPYAPFAGAMISLVGACLGFGLSKGPSITEQIHEMMDDLKTYIQTAFEEEKNDDILEVFTTQNRKYKTAVVFLEALITQEDIRKNIKDTMDEKEIDQLIGHNMFKLSQAELPQLTSVHYREFGLDILGKLQAQIEKYKDSQSENKKKHVAKYFYYYVQVAIWRRFILTLQCLLLKINGLNITYSAQDKVKKQSADDDDKFTGQFSDEKCGNDKFVQKYLQTYDVLNANEIKLINDFMKQKTFIWGRKFGGEGGAHFEKQGNTLVEGIKIDCGDYVNSIWIKMKGESWSLQFGGSQGHICGGKQTRKYICAGDEYFNKVMIRHDKYVTFVAFVTNKGNILQGGNGGGTFCNEYLGTLCGVQGNVGWYVNLLQFKWKDPTFIWGKEFGGEGGGYFEKHGTTAIQGIKIDCGDYVNAIWIKMKGEEWTQQFGGSQGHVCGAPREYICKDDEYFNKVMISYGKYVTFVAFVTNKGKIVQGGNGGGTFCNEYLGKLCGVIGKVGWYVNRLQFKWEKI